jgi:antigen flippase
VFLIYPIVRGLSGFRWSSENKQTALLFLSLIGVVFSGFYLLPFAWSIALGVAAMMVSGFYSMRTLADLLTVDRIPRILRPLLRWIRPAVPVRS